MLVRPIRSTTCWKLTAGVVVPVAVSLADLLYFCIKTQQLRRRLIAHNNKQFFKPKIPPHLARSLSFDGGDIHEVLCVGRYHIFIQFFYS
jgi:hypothetical protein